MSNETAKCNVKPASERSCPDPAGSAKTHRIDVLRQKMVAEGMSHEAAGIATGLAAEYAMDAYCEGYSKGYNDGHAKGQNDQDHTPEHTTVSGSCASPCSASLREHTILFTRDGGLDGVTDAAYCSFKCAEADGKMALSKAVTKWVETTDVGRAAWKESCEDFNIGDLACHQVPELLAEWGIHDLKVQVMAGAESWDYFDRHLVLPNAEVFHGDGSATPPTQKS